uniref:Uncharacterized protein n=1 Tax=Micrurus paraensis TaxID=1970185 RepID=A0A2D4KB65_9SAUR
MEEISKDFKLELQTGRAMLKEKRELLEILEKKIMVMEEEQRNSSKAELKEEEKGLDRYRKQETLPKDTKGIKTMTLMTESINKRENAPRIKQKKKKIYKKKLQKREQERWGGEDGQNVRRKERRSGKVRKGKVG